MGADDYITKPFSVREFRSRVKAALRRSRDARAAAPSERADRRRRAGIDFERRAVTLAASRCGSPTSSSRSSPPSPRAPGRVLTREMLLEQIWGDSAYRDPRTIDVHIRHLREKLERDPRAPEYLLTVRGVGYRFREGVGPELRSATAAAALFFAITAAAVGFIYLYVVPQLRSSLTAEKLHRLEHAAARSQGRLEAAMRAGAPEAELRALVRKLAQRSDARVTILGVREARPAPSRRSWSPTPSSSGPRRCRPTRPPSPRSPAARARARSRASPVSGSARPRSSSPSPGRRSGSRCSRPRSRTSTTTSR